MAKGYYTSVSGYMDELLWAAIWLYKATEKDEYLKYVLENANDFGGTTWAMTEFSWDVKYSGVQAIASMVNPSFSHFQVKKKYFSKSIQFLFIIMFLNQDHPIMIGRPRMHDCMNAINSTTVR